MDRLVKGMGQNSPQAYDAIYLKRKERGVDAYDLKRWKKLLQYYKGGRLIDMGCLDSLVPVLAKEAYPKAEAWGIDTAAQALGKMQEEHPEIIYRVEDVYKTSFPSNYFDYVVAGELIEHLEFPFTFFTEAFRILKHGGVLAISTPKEEGKEPGAVDAHRHLWSFSEEDIRSLIDSQADVWMKTLGSQYFPRYIYHWPTILAYARKI